MSPKAIADAELCADRHSHLSSVANLELGFNLCLVLLVVFLAQYILRLVSRKRRLLAHGNSFSEHCKKSALVHNNNIDQMAQTPAAVLRPQAPTLTPHSGPSRTILLPQGRYTGVVLPAPASRSPKNSSSSYSRGVVPRDVEAWRGIPYAQTTAGANRFRPPVPLPPYDDDAVVSVQADSFGQICPNTASPVLHDWEGEDCLNLNVYRPASCSSASAAAQRLPVVIYVHGGAFNGGSGTERNMASFVGWADIPLLAVSFNYRVGALGFPSSAMADREGCLNLGLQDQRLLFEWVRDNIGAFGGDSARVTIMGLSAGAHSVGYHLQSYTGPATAPFQAAIMESGGATARATLSPCHPRTESQWREFLLATTTTTAMSSNQVFARLRTLPLETILAASNAVFSRYQDPIRWPFQPVIESDAGNGRPVITDLPISSFRRGQYLQVPILTGFNTNEGTVFCSPLVDTNEQFLAKFTTMIPGLSDADLDALVQVYPDPVTQPDYPDTRYGIVPPGFGRQWARYEAAYAHYAYICPVLQTGHFYSNGDDSSSSSSSGSPAKKEEETSSSSPPIWVYEFAALARADYGGKANHADEAVLVSHDMDAIGQFPGLVATSDAMHGAFVRFVATGDPNPAATPTQQQRRKEEGGWWPRYTCPLTPKNNATTTSGQIMVFGRANDERTGGTNPGTPAAVRQLSEGEGRECRFWWDRVELSEGMGKRTSVTAVGGRARL